jgi:SpoVK/Ycf46/Vps4 family AAA+-type ATPase
LEEFDKFTIIDKKSRVSVLTRGSFGLETNSIKIDAPIIKNLELSYGSGFNKVHERIIEKLGGKKSSLMLFHGEAGSGKSSYIKYLTSLIDKEFIFIPIAYASELASPDLITLLLNHKDSILILEDAEKILESREVDTYNTSSVSTILNLSDGILSDLLNIKIIATFNCEADKTDPALRRKGRLSVDHYFGKLSHVDANKFAKSIGKETNFKESQSLADIYNLEEDTGHKEKEVRKMGFGA